MLLMALVLWNKTRGFIARAATAPGTVTELIEVRDNDGGSSTFKPVVKFVTPSGQEISFHFVVQQPAARVRRGRSGGSVVRAG